jgi:hypothetical protein
MDVMVDVLLVSSCRIMAGMVKTILRLLGALIALRHAGIDKHLLIHLNDSGFTFDEIADYVEQNNEIGFELIESNSEDSIHYYL